MRTLADVKRKMELGSNWHCVRLSGGNEDMGVREVGKVQGNAVAFLSGGKLSWLWWPKAKDVQVQGNSFTIFREAGTSVHPCGTGATDSQYKII